MKKAKWISIVYLLVLTLSFSNQTVAQDNKDSKPEMQAILQSKNYLFTAQYAQPLSGRQINLTSTYTVRIAGDSLVCYLPYYGQAYIVETYPGGGGLDFTSHHFEYSIAPAKHGRYMVSIKINDLTAVSQMFINVSKNGYANLQVTPSNRQGISYYGNIMELKKK